MRIGIDVGGTHTDAVLMRGDAVLAAQKTATSVDICSGIVTAVEGILQQSQVSVDDIKAVMIGTTHFINAMIERKHLAEVAVVRLCLPTTTALPPYIDWPDELKSSLGNHCFLLHGGMEYDGSVISELREDELEQVVAEIKQRDLKSVAISSVFSHVNHDMELTCAAYLQAKLPDISISMSHQVGGLGLLERENAAIINAALLPLAQVVIQSFAGALQHLNIQAPFYLSQNDGTLMDCEHALSYPVLTFASGATNSMRGAALLSGKQDAMVIDIGGTTSDVGMLQNGFPRLATTVVELGGVRSNFPIPDVLSFGLGGGSVISADGEQVGPRSVGFELEKKARIFKGDTLTATDIAVKLRHENIGDAAELSDLNLATAERAQQKIDQMIADGIDRMRTSRHQLPLIVVGGGAILIDQTPTGVTEMICPPHADVANAVGAAMTQVSGYCDAIHSYAQQSREEVLQQVKQQAIAKAVANGAAEESVVISMVQEIPMAYLPNNMTRVVVKAIGDLALLEVSNA